MEFAFSSDGRGSYVVLTGHMDASAAGCFQAISAQHRKTGTGALHFDCKGISAVNSVGVSAWYNFVKTENKQSKLYYFNCPQVMFDVTSIVPDIFAAGELQSIYVNYFCQACMQRTPRLFEAKELRQLEELPGDRCRKCTGEIIAEEDFDSIRDYLG